MPYVAIEALTPEHHDRAVHVLARAFVTNPMHVAVFGADHIEVNEAFFRIGLATMKGSKLVALANAQIVGVMHWAPSPLCQFSAVERLCMMPRLMARLGIPASFRLRRWLSLWSKHDPQEAHIHLGPIGITPKAQAQGIGHRLMERYCEELDNTGMAGYLETDRPENVEFYKRFGFDVTAAAPIFGVVNYFMKRPRKG